MSLSFPNQSRFYDPTRRAVRFWGYDSAMEVSFFVTSDALKRIKPDMRFEEAGVLSAFDLNRNRIYAIAAKVYGRCRKGSYDQIAPDFEYVLGAFKKMQDGGQEPHRRDGNSAASYWFPTLSRGGRNCDMAARSENPK